jgi:hypothetical protein
MGADNHLTVVPRNADAADDGDADEEHSADDDITPNYGVLR